jgi:hypothetical protein
LWRYLKPACTIRTISARGQKQIWHLFIAMSAFPLRNTIRFSDLGPARDHTSLGAI